MYPYIIQGNTIHLVIDGNTHTISDSHYCYSRVATCIKESRWADLHALLTNKQVVIDESYPHVTIEDNVVRWRGEVLNPALSKRIIWMSAEGYPIQPMLKFVENLKRNPSKTAVTELYQFLEMNTLPITEDGHFIAYKKVSDNYSDCYTNSVPNKPQALWTQSEIDELAKTPLIVGNNKDVYVFARKGKVFHGMRRNNVDDNRDNVCSDGLHFCSENYLPEYYSGRGRVVILKINPKNVVSIPSDYNFAKGRCCEYEVISEIDYTEEYGHSFNTIVYR